MTSTGLLDSTANSPAPNRADHGTFVIWRGEVPSAYSIPGGAAAANAFVERFNSNPTTGLAALDAFGAKKDPTGVIEIPSQIDNGTFTLFENGNTSVPSESIYSVRNASESGISTAFDGLYGVSSGSYWDLNYEPLQCYAQTTAADFACVRRLLYTAPYRYRESLITPLLQGDLTAPPTLVGTTGKAANVTDGSTTFWVYWIGSATNRLELWTWKNNSIMATTSANKRWTFTSVAANVSFNAWWGVHKTDTYRNYHAVNPWLVTCTGQEKCP